MVCSLNFSISATSIVNASNDVTANGSFTVVATDPNATTSIWMSLGSDFTYGRGRPRISVANDEPVTFENLLPGSYVVYARNSTSCLATITVRVDRVYNYQPRHRLLFDKLYQNAYDPANQTYKLDIEDAEYVGEVIEEKGGDKPVVLTYNNEANQDPFSPVVSSKLDVTLNSPSDNYFEHLYTYDERRFRASFYEYDGSDYVLIWRGYIVPMLFKEQYWINFNYDVTFTFTDGIADLKNKSFSDLSGNYPTTRISFFDAIRFCLQQTNIELDIWDAVDIVNTNLNTDEDDSILTQVYFDPSVYTDSPTSGEVLESILRNVKARIYQAEGVWHIENVSRKPSSTVSTRVYSFDGTQSSYGDENQRIMLRRSSALGEKISLKDRSGMIETVERYGQYKLTYNLSIEDTNNILEYGEFEAQDLENGQFKGWSVIVQGDNPDEGTYEFGLESLNPPVDNSDEAFYVQFNNLLTSQQLSIPNIRLVSAPFSLSFPGTGAFSIRLKFNLFTRPLYTGPYVYIDFSIQEYLAVFSVPYSLQAKEIYKDGSGNSVIRPLTTDLIENKYLRIYIDDHITWKTIEVDIVIESQEYARAYELEFRLSKNPVYDVNTIASLKSVVTSGKKTQTFANRYRVLDGFFIRWYSLEAGDDSESLPDVVRPNDYGTYGLNFVWKLKETYQQPSFTTVNGIPIASQFWLQSLLIDRVSIAYLPEKQDPLQEIISSLSINNRISPILEEEVLHGDLEINNGMDANYFLISRSILTNSVGSPLQGGWKMRGADGDGFYLTKLLGDLVKDFYSDKRILLTGSTDIRDKRPSFYNSVYEVRTGRVFVNSSLSVDFRNVTATHELIEMLKGEPIIDEGDPPLPGDPGGPDPIEPPVNIREHTNEFSNEFA